MRRRLTTSTLESSAITAAATKSRRPYRRRKRQTTSHSTGGIVVFAIIFFFAGAFLFQTATYIYRRHHYFLGCPEAAIFTRRPKFSSSNEKRRTIRNSVTGGRYVGSDSSSTPKLHYLTAKFGPPGNTEIPKQVSSHVESILSQRLFTLDEVKSYTTIPQFLLDDPDYKRHLQFYLTDNHSDRSSRGGGYWFWKPNLIYHHLQHDMQDGDYLIYTDADRVDFLSWLAYLLETMQERNADLVLEQMQFKEKEWTKGDIYSYFNDNASQQQQQQAPMMPDADESLQYNGSLIILQKNAATVQFVSDWIEVVKNYHLLSDEPSIAPNAKGFKENRHDQSLVSMLIKYNSDYMERGKEAMVWDCLGDWVTYTFRIKE